MEPMTHKTDYGKEYATFFGLLAILVALAVLVSVYMPITPSFWMNVMLNTMGLFFIIFGIFQLVGYKDFVMVFPKYDPIAKHIPGYARVYPFLSIAAGVLYLMNLFVPWRDIVVACVLLVAAVGLARMIRLDYSDVTRVPCVCLGNIIKLPISWVTLGEDLIMGGMALVMAIMHFV